MDKQFFDSLKNDADTKHPKPTDFPFNGIYYRSAAERDIAVFYTEMGLPFKCEPEITIKGNYANAGLILGVDAIFTYDTDDTPFDIRYLETLLNSCIYETALLF